MTTLTWGLGCASAALTWFTLIPLRYLLVRRDITAQPNERSLHTIPTPRGGGLAIVAVSVLGGLAYVLLHQGRLDVFGYWALGAVLVAGVGWLDDLFSLTSLGRYLAQSCVAVVIMIRLGHWDTVALPMLGDVHFGWVGILLTYFWIVGLMNAYNFMDGLDGLAGGQAVIAGAGWAILGWLGAQPHVAALGLVLAASSLGFLGHNWSPARIFLGDVGSTFLGYAFATLPLLARYGSAGESRPDRYGVAAVLLVWPFLFDSVFTILRRWWNGENIFTVHRAHIYQRLAIAGLGHRFVSSLYIALAFLGLLLALGWFLEAPYNSVIVVVAVPVLCLALWSYVGLRERKLLAEV